MNKKLFYLAAAVCAALLCFSCGSDDASDTPNNTITLKTPKYVNEVARYTIKDASAVKTSVADAPALTSINVTESGKVVFELKSTDGKKKYVTTPATINGNTITLTGNRGTIIKQNTKSSSSNMWLTLNITIDLPGLGTITYTTDTDNPVQTLQTLNTITGGVALTYLARTWYVKSMIIDLTDGITGYKEFSGGSLKQVCEYAQGQGATFTESEIESFNKTISSIDISSTGMFTINYDNGTVDAGDWNWVNSQYESLKLKLLEEGMGNKFIADNSSIAIAFSGNMCSLKLNTKITGSKNYVAMLTLVLQSAE